MSNQLQTQDSRAESRFTRQQLVRSQTLLQRQSLPLEDKVRMSLARIRDWYEFWDGLIYGSFSGGKDSLVLKHLIRKLYPDVPLVFSNTGLEYPEIVQFVKEELARDPHIVIVRPKRTFRDVVLNEGYPVVSKKVSRQLRILKMEKDNPAWANSYRLYDTGKKKDGTVNKASKLPSRLIAHVLISSWHIRYWLGKSNGGLRV